MTSKQAVHDGWRTPTSCDQHLLESINPHPK